MVYNKTMYGHRIFTISSSNITHKNSWNFVWLQTPQNLVLRYQLVEPFLIFFVLEQNRTLVLLSLLYHDQTAKVHQTTLFKHHSFKLIGWSFIMYGNGQFWLADRSYCTVMSSFAWHDKDSTRFGFWRNLHIKQWTQWSYGFISSLYQKPYCSLYYPANVLSVYYYASDVLKAIGRL